MSEHAWVLESIASYCAGGLELEERERLERHTAECPACAQDVAETRAFDRKVAGLFESVKPGAAMEERLVRALRVQPRRRPIVIQVLLAAAAVFFIAFIGWEAVGVIQTGRLPLADFWNRYYSWLPAKNKSADDLAIARSTAVTVLDDTGSTASVAWMTWPGGFAK
jgi:anti-sigma factor RsiW